MFFSIRRIDVVCVFLFGFGTTLQAATPEVTAPIAEITLAQAIELALRHNPELMAVVKARCGDRLYAAPGGMISQQK